LAAEFLFGDQKLFVIANHFASKRGNNAKEPQRIQQATLVRQFVEQILDKDPQASVIVLGDLNDEPDSTTLKTLTDNFLVNLATRLLSPTDAYSYVFQGRRELIDYLLVSQHLFDTTQPTLRIPHVAADRLKRERVSDHDPIVASFSFQTSTAGSGGTTGGTVQPTPEPESWATLFPTLTGSVLVEQLRAKYSPQQTLSYGKARDLMFGKIDNFNGAVTDLYGGRTIQLSPTGDPSQNAGEQDFNTEHVWPQSKGASAEPQKSDLHHLYPVDERINSDRGNKPFAEIPDAQTSRWLRGREILRHKPTRAIEDYSESTNTSFEPREDRKGDVARAVFYFYTIYESEADDSFFAKQRPTLCQWNRQDPIGASEMARSHTIATVQGNENPFVLDATLADRAYCQRA
jgi:hypothetical protein